MMMRLRHLATITNSNVDKVTSPDEHPVRLCNYVDVYKNDRITNDLDFMDASATQIEIRKFGLKVGDVLITKDSEDRSDIAVPAYVTETADDLVCGYHLALLRARQQLIKGKFLFWALQSKQAREAFSNAAGGVTRFGLTLDGIKSVELPCPDLETQTAVGDFLDSETARIDQLIDKKLQLVHLLDQKEKSKISSLVLRGIDSNAKLVDSEIEWRGQVPVHWNQSRLKAHFRVKKRQGYPDLTVLSVYRDYGVIEKDSRDDNINKTPLDLTSYQLVCPGDLVINKMKSWQGSLGVSNIEGITSPDYVVMTPVGAHYPTYMHFLLRARPMPSVYHMISNGIRIDQWRLEPDRFLSLPIFLPPLEEQKQIAREVEQIVSRLRHLIEITVLSIDRLRELRATLITAAVTGQIDVTTWGKKGQTDSQLEQIKEAIQA
ncbi:MAG: restriction endonuclease subunit S [Candidatus Thiodiazotropha sp.]